MNFYLKSSVVIGLSLLAIIGLSYVLVSTAPHHGCKMRGKQPQYWNNAPNGEYEALITIYFDDNLTAHTPYCPSYGGQLHGNFAISPSIVLPDLKYYEYKNFNVTKRCLEGWVLATIEDNIITEMELLT